MSSVNNASAEIQQAIDEGEKLLAAGHYHEAVQTFTGAITEAQQGHMLTFYRDLEERLRRAHDLDETERRVADLIERCLARSLQSQDDTEQTLQELSRQLNDLPDDADYAPLAQRLREARREVEEQLNTQMLRSCIRTAYNKFDYATVVALAQRLPPSAHEPIVAQARTFLEDVIQPKLQRAEELRREHHWEEALAELEALRDDFSKTPDWRRAWVLIELERGNLALREGHMAVDGAEFAVAARRFQEALDAFERALKEAPEHPVLKARQQDASDMRRLAAAAERATNALADNRREKALEALKEAAPLLEQARRDGRMYLAIGTTITTMRQQVEEEQARITTEKQRLAEAKKLEGQRRWHEALALFIATVGALLSEDRLTAREGRNRTQEAIKTFEELLARAQAVADPYDAVVHAQRASDQYPTGPQVANILETTLIRAATEARNQQQEDLMLRYLNRAWELNPDNPLVNRWRREPDLLKRATVALEQTARTLDTLLSQDQRRAEDLDALLDNLRPLLDETASDYQDLHQQLDSQARGLAERRERWAQAERVEQEADELRRTGQWDMAFAALTRAKEALGDDAPALLAERHAQWKEIHEQIVQAGAQAEDVLSRARAAYEEGQFEPALHLSQEAIRAIEGGEHLAHEAGGGLPGSLVELRRQIELLDQRSSVAVSARRATSAIEGLRMLRAITQPLNGHDLALEALEQRLRQQMLDELEQTLRQAEEAAQASRLDEAVELLQEVNQRLPGHARVAPLLESLQHRRELWNAINSKHQAARLNAETNSLPEARKAWREALDLLLDPDAGVADEDRAALSDLLELEQQGLERSEVWEATKATLGRLRKPGARSEPRRLVGEIALRWANTARDLAHQAVITSMALLGDLLGAYRESMAYYEKRHEDESAPKLVREYGTSLLTKLVESADRRVTRAREGLARGQPQIALENVLSLEQDVFQQAGQAGPNFLRLFDGEQTLEARRAEAELLKIEAQALQKQLEEVNAALDRAERAFVEDGCDAAERELPSGADLSRLPHLAGREQSLRERIAQARKRLARSALRAALLDAQTALENATNVPTLEQTLEQLDALRTATNWSVLEREDEELYQQKVSRIHGQIQEFRAAEVTLARAHELMEQGEYTAAVPLLEQVLPITRDGQVHAQLEQELRECRDHVARQQGQEHAARQAVELLNSGDYTGARQAISAAHKLGVNVEDLSKLVRAGSLLRGAEQLWADERDMDQVLHELEEAARLVEGVPEGDDLVIKIQRAQTRIRKDRVSQEQLQSQLSEVHRALNEGNLSQASQLSEPLLVQFPKYPEVQDIREQIERMQRVKALLERAEEARANGKYLQALTLVQDALQRWEDHADATVLRAQIEAESKANDALRQAEAAILEKAFDQARSELNLARQRQADPQRVQEVQDRLQRAEKAWHNDILDPINQKLHDAEFSDALGLVDQALQRSLTGDLRDRVQQIRGKIIAAWVSHALTLLNQRLDQARTADEYLDMIGEIEQLQQLDPLTNLQKESLARFLVQVQTSWLRAQLSQARGMMADTRTLQEAAALVERVHEQARKLERHTVAHEATLLRTEIEDQEERTMADREAAMRQRRLDAARQVLGNATEIADFHNAISQAQLVLEMPSFNQDDEARNLIRQIEDARQAFELTMEALARARDQLLDKEYERAIKELRPPRLNASAQSLQHTHARLLHTLELLRDAQQAERAAKWEDALGIYDQALKEDNSLELLLERDIDRCRERLAEQATIRVREMLGAEQPDFNRAREILERAVQMGWLDNEAKITGELRTRLHTRAAVVRAVEMLDHDDQSLDQVLDHLREARRTATDSDLEGAIRQVELLMQALHAHESGDLKQAHALTNRVGPPLVGTQRMRQWRSTLEQSIAVSTSIAAARQRLQEALDAADPNWAEAVDVVRDTRDQAGADPQVLQLVQELRDRLGIMIDMACDAGEYAQAIKIGNELRRLEPQDLEVRRKVEALPEAREQAFARALAQAEQHLRDYALAAAEQMLTRLRTIAAPESDPRIADLQQQLERQRTAVREAEEHITASEKAIGQGAWAQAIMALEQAQRLAPGYTRVAQANQQTQQQLLRVAHDLVQAQMFREALTIYDLGLRIDPCGEILVRRQETVALRDGRIEELRQQVRDALADWNLEAASGILAGRPEFALDDDQLLRLEQRLAEMKQQSAGLKRTMDASWNALAHQDYHTARQTFISVAGVEPPLREAAIWHDYVAQLTTGAAAIEEEQFAQANVPLDNAVRLMRDDPIERLPSIFGGQRYLWSLRSQAAATAEQLRDLARSIGDQYRLYLQEDAHGNLAKAVQAIDSVVELKQQFMRLYRATPASALRSVSTGGGAEAPNGPPGARPTLQLADENQTESVLDLQASPQRDREEQSGIGGSRSTSRIEDVQAEQ